MTASDPSKRTAAAKSGGARQLDAIVLGAGGVGSAALYHLARRGARAIAIDRFAPPHDRGSTHGETRVIRMAYFEHPDYVPLLRRAYALWVELEKETGVKLYHEAGLLEAGPADGVIVPGVLESARRHDLDIEELEPRQAETRFPGFRVPASLAAVYERRAGYLLVEACVEAHLAAARAAGGEVRSGEAVLGWQPAAGGVEVRTDRGAYRARRLIIAPGAWADDVLGDLGLRFEVRRKSLFWYEARDPAYSDGPCFFYEMRRAGKLRFFYGFPARKPHGLKVAEHSGGAVVSDPLAVSREIDPAERAAIESFLGPYLPGVGRDLARHAVCLYTMTPDEHFIVGAHPRHPEAAIACGLSGHGFKFAPVLGEILADLTLDGGTTQPIGFLSPGRFARG